MSCQARRRWKTGTQFTNPVQSDANTELQARLAQMKSEREQQDTMWQDPPAQLIVLPDICSQHKITLPNRENGK